MIPQEFAYHAPRSLKEALDLLARDANAKVLGGGMSLIPAMKHRLQVPSALVDLARVPELEGLRDRRGAIAVVGRTPHAALAGAKELADLPGLLECAGSIGDVQVRNRGTIGGSLVHADPAADWPAAFLAFEGEATVVGPKGERTVSAGQFFTGMLASAVGHDEVLTEVRFNLDRKRAGTAYVKLRQPASGFAIVGVAAQVWVDKKGRIEKAAVGVTGVNPVPFRAGALEKKLIGAATDAASLRGLCGRIDEADPMEDLHASSDYRAHLVGVFAARALATAAGRASA